VLPPVFLQVLLGPDFGEAKGVRAHDENRRPLWRRRAETPWQYLAHERDIDRGSSGSRPEAVPPTSIDLNFEPVSVPTVPARCPGKLLAHSPGANIGKPHRRRCIWSR
jgi:hypothetical protein